MMSDKAVTPPLVSAYIKSKMSRRSALRNKDVIFESHTSQSRSGRRGGPSPQIHTGVLCFLSSDKPDSVAS